MLCECYDVCGIVVVCCSVLVCGEEIWIVGIVLYFDLD